MDCESVACGGHYADRNCDRNGDGGEAGRGDGDRYDDDECQSECQHVYCWGLGVFRSGCREIMRRKGRTTGSGCRRLGRCCCLGGLRCLLGFTTSLKTTCALCQDSQPSFGKMILTSATTTASATVAVRSKGRIFCMTKSRLRSSMPFWRRMPASFLSAY